MFRKTRKSDTESALESDLKTALKEAESRYMTIWTVVALCLLVLDVVILILIPRLPYIWITLGFALVSLPITSYVQRLWHKLDVRRDVREFSKRIKDDPSNLETYVERAAFYHFQGRLDDALRDLEMTLAMDATYASAYLERANIYAHQKQYQSALADYSQALAFARNDETKYTAYYNRAMTYFSMGEHELALPDFHEAANTPAQYWQRKTATYLYLGYCYEAQEQYEDGLLSYRKFLELVGPREAEFFHPYQIPRIRSKIKKLEKRLK